MDTIKFKKGNVKMIAHGGLSGIECGNTCAAFIAAGNRSYWGIECDIHYTKDGEFVVFHDDSTGRLADKDYTIEETDYAALKQLVLCDGRVCGNYLTIATLCEYIAICKRYGKHCVLELKNIFPRQSINRVINIIRDYDYLDNVTFISFKLENLLYIREILPEQSAQYIVSEIKEDLIDCLVKNRLDIDVKIEALNETLVNDLKSHGIVINCWTCDQPEHAERLVSMGVDFITSNILE